MKNLVKLFESVDNLGYATFYHVIRFDKKHHQDHASSFVYSDKAEAVGLAEALRSSQDGYIYIVEELYFKVN